MGGRARGVALGPGTFSNYMQMLGGDRTFYTFCALLKQLDCSTGLLWGL